MNQAVQNTSPFSMLARRVGAFSATFVVGLFACPLLIFAIHPVVPRVVGNFMFFWPQLALVTYGFTSPARDMTRTYLGGGWNYVITAAFWLLVGVGLSWLLRKKPILATVLATLPVSFAIAIAAEAVLDYFDIGIYFEGP